MNIDKFARKIMYAYCSPNVLIYLKKKKFIRQLVVKIIDMEKTYDRILVDENNSNAESEQFNKQVEQLLIFCKFSSAQSILPEGISEFQTLNRQIREYFCDSP